MRPTFQAVLAAAIWLRRRCPPSRNRPTPRRWSSSWWTRTAPCVPEAAVSVDQRDDRREPRGHFRRGGSGVGRALPLTGIYEVTVSKEGFADGTAGDITLRAGETATIRVKLLVAGGHERRHRLRHDRRRARDPQIGVRLDSPRIDETPILGRKVDDAAAAQFGVPAGQGDRRSLRQRDVLHHRRGLAPRDHVHARRREQRRGVGPADGDRHRAARRHPGNRRCSRTRFRPNSAGPPGPALNIVTKSGTNGLHGEGAVPGPSGRAGRRRRSRPRDFCPPSVPSCVTPTHAHAINPVDIPDALEPGLRLDRRADRQGQDLLLRHGRLHAAGSNDVPLAHAAGLRAAGGWPARLHRALPPDALRRPAGPQAHARTRP